ncbi:serine/threonine protein kinase [Streptomyces hiroshimensis]|uniref:Serine/threonine protein kinase n=1 Tax=Streptomyces hiroshimensis TaxID=66424 RepID=A0ABQ2ZFI4_9ACTN|nr:serine/threonine protein kinase [Streptomyces hiroshimensis]GGY12359.1 serine/threonine protein kinase [Streptomyces hiroshimensis]
MASHPLLDVTELPSVEAHLERIGTVFASFRDQDSGCVSYGVRLPGGERWFVKEGTSDGARRSLCRAWAFHRAVSHPVIVPQVHRIAVRGNWAVVMPWHDGEVLYHPTTGGTADRTAPGSAMARFRALPLSLVMRAWDRILSAHLAVEEAGHVAVDFYDGALLYDFTGDTMRLVDLDEYRPGPFVLEADRLPGSRRFMAPEEYERGATIDARTTVFVLGRAARLLLDAGDDERAWRGGPARLKVLHRATRADPGERFASVRRFAAAWHAAGSAPEGSPRPGTP